MISIKDFIYSFVKRCLSLADLRLLWARIMDKYTPQDCVRMFVETMNKKSQQWNLKSSFWIDPSGLGIKGRYSQTTAFDIAMLGFYALSYPKLREIWNNGSMRLMKIQKPYLFHPHKRTLRRIGANIESGLLAGRYPIIGGKTGAGGGGYTLLIISKLDKIFGGGYIIGSVLNAVSPEARFDAMKELFDCVAESNDMSSTNEVFSAQCACAMFTPNEKTLPRCLFRQNDNLLVAPMSITKVLTACVVLDYFGDLQRRVRVRPCDLIGTEGTSGNVFKAWEKVSIEDLLYAALLPSSNQAANVLARVVGHEILCQC